MLDPVHILTGDTIECMRTLPDGGVQCCVTSPPYFSLRDYGCAGQIGLESTPDEYIEKLVGVFAEVRRVLREDGTLWLNIGDSYNAYNGNRSPAVGLNKGLKSKDLMMIPWRVALALQASGWYLRSVIVWAKKSPMPESVTDRPTSSWEPIFLLAKSDRYYYDAEAVKEASLNPGVVTGGGHKHSDNVTVPGAGKQNLNALGARPLDMTRNQRNVWHLGPEAFPDAHFATFPTEIPRRAIKAGTSEKGCCPACSAPWRRQTERKQLTRERPNDYTKRNGENGTGNSCANSVAGVEVRTVGWEPTCECNAGEPVPCRVLDPFLGSGTTIAVARTLGRHGVGCELNPKYVELARDRIGKAERPQTYASSAAKEAPLFEAASAEGTT